MLDEKCEPVVLELNDRPSLAVTYPIEQELKSNLVYDALNVVTVDGEDPGERAVPGGWMKIAPVDEEAPFGRMVQPIVSRVLQATAGLQTKPAVQRLGGAAAPVRRGPKRSAPAASPLQ
jgi:hypothetical protein